MVEHLTENQGVPSSNLGLGTTFEPEQRKLTKPRPFRFGVQAHRARHATEWRERARRFESMGFDALYIPDHFDSQLAPFTALTSAAAATSTLRVGTLVLDNDYRHPVVVAKEAATLDVLADGRLDLGLGAGWLVADYEQSGIRFDPPATRIERLDEAVKVIKGMFTGEPFSFSGKHYSVNRIRGFPQPVQQPHPPILLGGGGRRMLGLAAREADIVHINYDLREGRINPALVKTGMADRTLEKISWVEQAAGERFDEIELAMTVFVAAVTDDREAFAASVATGIEAEVRDVLEMPHFLIGSVEQIAGQLLERRERYGFSNVVLPGATAEQLAPVVERLAGR